MTYISAAEVVVVVSVGDPAVLPQTLISPGNHLVEDVEVPLAGVLVDNTRLLKKKVGNHAPSWLTSIEYNLSILALKVNRGSFLMFIMYILSYLQILKSYCF